MISVDLSNVAVNQKSFRQQASAASVVFTSCNLSIRPGETVALVGTSGAGKSTLARMLLGHLPSGLACTAGSIAVDGGNPFELSASELRQFRRRCCFIDQDPGAALPPKWTVRKILNARAKLAGLGSVSDAAALEALSDLGFSATPDLLNRRPAQLSGGQRRRVGIAAGIIARPELLIIDEPTAGVDAGAKQRVLAAVAAALTTTKATGLVITHDLGVAHAVADRVVRLSADGTVAVPAPANPPEPLCNVVRKSQSRPVRGSGTRRVRLQVEGLQIVFADQVLVDDLTFDVGEGEIVALSGASGAGKTSIVRALSGLLGLGEVNGALSVDGSSVPWPVRKRKMQVRQKFSWIPQEAELALNPSVRVSSLLRRSGASGRQLESMMAALKVNSLASQRPDELSGGQRQRVCVAAEVLRGRPILLCDEPTSALDDDNAAAVIELIRTFASKAAVVVASHDPRLLAVADRIITVGEQHRQDSEF